MAVGLDDLPYPQLAAQLEKKLVFVGGVDEEGVSGLAAPNDMDVVVDRSDHHPMDFDEAVLVVEHAPQLKRSSG
jgi:hypothetical protein